MYVSRRASKVDLRGGASIYMYVYIYIYYVYIYIYVPGEVKHGFWGGASIYIYILYMYTYVDT